MSKSKAKGTPIDKVERVLFQALADMSGWRVGDHYKCGYSGDCYPIRHGGFFYDTRDWRDYGYASCVEFWEHPDTGHIHVTCGTITRPDDEEVARLLEQLNADDIDEQYLIHAEIDVVRGHWGMEPTEDFNGPYSKSFDLETWQEWRIWRSVHGWLKALGE